MTRKQKNRLWFLCTCFIGSAGVGLIMIVALRENMMYFVSPSELFKMPSFSRDVRLGGVVQKNSITKDPDSLTTHFILTDGEESVQVAYHGIVPDLFREGQGAIVDGRLFEETKVFKAHRLLAKHDETYMPPVIKKDSIFHEGLSDK